MSPNNDMGFPKMPINPYFNGSLNIQFREKNLETFSHWIPFVHTRNVKDAWANGIELLTNVVVGN